MKFTDEDLKRAKEIAANRVLVDPPAEIGWWWRHTAALIARLEAAEGFIDSIDCKAFSENQRIAFGKWLKAAGK